MFRNNSECNKSVEHRNMQNIKFNQLCEKLRYEAENNVHYVLENYEVSSKIESINRKNIEFENNVLCTTDEFFGNTFDNFGLIDLLYYNVDLMPHEKLFNYAFALKNRILEKILEFKDPEKNELEFLCNLTDGSQTVKNQKLITARKHLIVSKVIGENLHRTKSDTYSNNSKSEILEQNENSDLILKNNELNKFSGHNENIDVKHAVLNKDCENKDIRGSSYNNLTDNDCRNNLEGSLPSEIWESTHVTEGNSASSIKSKKIVSNSVMQAHKDVTYSSFGLKDLLNYDVTLMDHDSFLAYSFVLRKRILENFSRFDFPENEKLEFLCKLTDGTQTERNQKIITLRMCHLISISLKRHM